MKHFFLLFTGIFICLLLSCLSGKERDAQKQIREKYKAEEVRIHFPEEEIQDSVRNIAEIIVIKSQTLDQTRGAFEDCLDIATLFFKALSDRNRYFGVRVIISNPSEGSRVSGLSKSFFYEKNLLEH